MLTYSVCFWLCLCRNVSSDGAEARRRLRECEGLVDALLHALQSAVGKKDMDNKVGQNMTHSLTDRRYLMSVECTSTIHTVYTDATCKWDTCLPLFSLSLWRTVFVLWGTCPTMSTKRCQGLKSSRTHQHYRPLAQQDHRGRRRMMLAASEARRPKVRRKKVWDT